MICTCVSTEIKEARGQQYAVFWFKKDPDNKFEKPIRIVRFGQAIVDALENGVFDKYLDIEQVEYSLQQPVKHPCGIIMDKLHLNCIKVPVMETVFKNNCLELGHHYYTGSVWARGFSPEELAADAMRILVPVQEQLANS